MAEAGFGRTAAVVLAGGEGSRFAGETPKLLTPFRGRPLVAWALEAALGAGLGGVALVSGAVDLSPVLGAFAGVVALDNPRWREGQATSVRRGLEWCAAGGYEAAVVGLADQPLVPSSAWRAVARASGFPVATATYARRRSPPVRLHRSVWALVPESGDEGARALMRRRPDLVGEVACEGDPADVDTLADLRGLLGGGRPPASATEEG